MFKKKVALIPLFMSISLFVACNPFKEEPIVSGGSSVNKGDTLIKPDTDVVIVDSCALRNVTPPKRVIGYIPTWRNFEGFVKYYQFKGLTHVNIAFINANQSDQSIFFGAQENNPDDISSELIAELVSRAHEVGTKVIPSLGGATGKGYPQMLSDAEKRYKMIDSIVAFVKKNNFDGVDIDIEWEQVHRVGYALFVDSLAKVMKKENLIFSAAVARGMIPDYISGATLKKFDFVGIMSYDYIGSWDWKALGKPLYFLNPRHHSSYTQAVSDVNYFTKSVGLCADQTVLGVPFYGLEYKAKLSQIVTHPETLITKKEVFVYDTLIVNNVMKIYENKTTVNVKTPNFKNMVTDSLYDYSASQIGYDYVYSIDSNVWNSDSVNVGLQVNLFKTPSYILNSGTTIRKKAQVGIQYGGIMVWDLSTDLYKDEKTVTFHEKSLMPVILQEFAK
jgi:GH18 family chitinase